MNNHGEPSTNEEWTPQQQQLINVLLKNQEITLDIIQKQSKAIENLNETNGYLIDSMKILNQKIEEFTTPVMN